MVFSRWGQFCSLTWHLLGRQSMAVEPSILGTLKADPSNLCFKKVFTEFWYLTNIEPEHRFQSLDVCFRIIQGHWMYRILGSGQVRNQAIVLQSISCLFWGWLGDIPGSHSSSDSFSFKFMNWRTLILKLLDVKTLLRFGDNYKNVMHKHFLCIQFQESQTPSCLPWTTR